MHRFHPKFGKEKHGWEKMDKDQLREYFTEPRDFIFLTRFLHLYNYNIEHSDTHLPTFMVVGDSHACRFQKVFRQKLKKNISQKLKDSIRFVFKLQN